MSADFPSLATLLPQAGPMRLLGHVTHHDAHETRCLADPARAHLFADAEGRVPVWVALEWMAQCAAAHAGLHAHARGEPPLPGLLVGSRRLVFRMPELPGAEAFEVRARPVAGAAARPAPGSGGGGAAPQRNGGRAALQTNGGRAAPQRNGGGAAPQRNGGRAAFACAVLDPWGGAPLVEGRLNVLVLPAAAGAPAGAIDAGGAAATAERGAGGAR